MWESQLQAQDTRLRPSVMVAWGWFMPSLAVIKVKACCLTVVSAPWSLPLSNSSHGRCLLSMYPHAEISCIWICLFSPITYWNILSLGKSHRGTDCCQSMKSHGFSVSERVIHELYVWNHWDAYNMSFLGTILTYWMTTWWGLGFGNLHF